jgi:histidinol-phosphatase (PHP family)
MLTDLHVHTLFSCDSKTTMEEYCEEAINQGVKYLCFTDHVDYNKNYYGYGFYKPQEYFEEFNRIQDKYSDKINLLSGIEFSEPYVYQKEFEKISKLPYDFILGSIHCWIDDMFASELQKRGISLKEAFEKYWIEVYKTVSFGGFDSLAHIDFPKRYYKDSLWDEDVV